MTRIVAGEAGGRKLIVPRGEVTRPTSDRVREALFSALDARGLVTRSRVLDLYCGSGALGLEAASRGAASVVLVDASRQAVEAARRNVSTLGFPRVTVVLSSVQRYLDSRAPMAASLVFADPPYAMGQDELAGMLRTLTERSWLQPDATVLVERSSRSLEPNWPEGLARPSVRRYGETSVWQAQWLADRLPERSPDGGP
jgi:16S rRNA (guanine966-N2)-methyltransferase